MAVGDATGQPEQAGGWRRKPEHDDERSVQTSEASEWSAGGDERGPGNHAGRGHAVRQLCDPLW